MTDSSLSRRQALALLAAASATPLGALAADAFPGRDPVKIIVGYSAGGAVASVELPIVFDRRCPVFFRPSFISVRRTERLSG